MYRFFISFGKTLREDKIKRQVVYQNYDKEGLRVPNGDVMMKPPRLAWISWLLSNAEK